MKRLISILLIFIITLSMTTVIFADWPTNYGTEPTGISYATYPYRFMYFNQASNSYYYIACNQRFRVTEWDSGPKYMYGVEVVPANVVRYKLSMVNNVPTWSYLDNNADYASFNYDYDIKYSNQDIYAANYNTPNNKYLIHASDISTLSGTVTYISPIEGMKDNINTFSFLANYSVTVPANADKNKLKVEITGGVTGSGEVLSHDFKTTEGKWNGSIRFSRVMYPGANAIKISIKYDGKTVASAIRNVTYFDDFIDANEDGLDDRTGQTEAPDRWEMPIEDNTPDGSILGYIKWAFENITYIFDGVVGLVEGLFKMTGKMSIIIGEYMGALPKPINTVLVIGCLVAIILKIFGR